MSNIISATEARNNFFHLLSRVLYGGETIFISKEGADNLAKIESVPVADKTLKELAGSISVKDARAMKKAVAATRTYPRRRMISF